MPGLANSLVTDAGIAAAVAAGSSGPLVNITGFTLGSQSAAQGASAQNSDTAVDGLVFTGNTSYMSVQIQNTDTVLFRIMLGQAVGDFNIGQIGLMMGSTLFSKHVLTAQTFKTVGSPPTTLGNVKVFDVALKLTNLANLLNLSFISAMYASLPEVDDETGLPPASSSTYSAYLVHAHTQSNQPATAVRVDSAWSYISHFDYPNQGVGVIPVVSGLFHADATVGKVVYWSVTDTKFRMLNATVLTNQAVGIRTSTGNITTTGVIHRSAAGIGTAMTPGAVYYATSTGTLSTSVLGRPIAIALTANDLFVNCAYNEGLGGFAANPLYAVAGGTANALTATIAAYAPGTTLVEGRSFILKAASANTSTTVTLALNGGSALPLVAADSTLPPVSGIVANQLLELVYQNAPTPSFKVISPLAAASAVKEAAYTRGRIVRLTGGSSWAWSVPAETTIVEVELVGGGGGGGYGTGGSPTPGGGGGGSAGWVVRGFYDLSSLAGVGSIGGAMGQGGAMNTNATDTTWSTNIVGGTARAEGGRASAAAAAGAATSPGSPANTSTIGGLSSGVVLVGGQGDGGFIFSGAAYSIGGRGAYNAAGGCGGNPGAGGTNANPGLAPGGGGGGAAGTTGSSFNGAAGADGHVIIRY